jgi:hypothetical protein
MSLRAHEGFRGFLAEHYCQSQLRLSQYFIGLSRRDDIESLASILLELLQGPQGLPWDGFAMFSSGDQDDSTIMSGNAMVAAVKEDTAQEICSLFSPVFSEFLAYAHSLSFDEAPDYRQFRRMFSELAKKR